jgi:PAS domain S-box-containing protein
MPYLRKIGASLHPGALPEYGPFRPHEPLRLAALTIERTQVPMIMTDPCQWDNPIVLANKAFLDLTGYQAREVEGRNCRFLQGDSTSPLVIAEMRSALDEERDFAATLLNYRKDGSAFWNELSVSHIHDAEGELSYYLASQRSASQAFAADNAEHPSQKLAADESEEHVLALIRDIAMQTRQSEALSLPVRMQGCSVPFKWRKDVLPVQSVRRYS